LSRHLYRSALPAGTPDDIAAAEPIRLDQNIPNPCSREARITFRLPSPRHVRLDLFDLRGACVATLVDEPRMAGEHTVAVDASRLRPGVYTCCLRAGASVVTRSMTVIR
jgi:hypothetical protein